MADNFVPESSTPTASEQMLMDTLKKQLLADKEQVELLKQVVSKMQATTAPLAGAVASSGLIPAFLPQESSPIAPPAPTAPVAVPPSTQQESPEELRRYYQEMAKKFAIDRGEELPGEAIPAWDTRAPEKPKPPPDTTPYGLIEDTYRVLDPVELPKPPEKPKPKQEEEPAPAPTHAPTPAPTPETKPQEKLDLSPLAQLAGTMPIFGGQASALTRAMISFASVGSSLRGVFTGAGGGGGNPPGNPPSGDAGGVASLAGGMGKALVPVAAFAMAAKTASDALNGIVSASVRFVQAVAPGTVQVMNLAMRDLTAVIGTALVPIVQGATAIFREIGAFLLPVMEKLKGVIGDTVGTFMTVFSGVFEKVFMPIVQAVQPLLEAFNAVYEATLPVSQLIASVLGVAIKMALAPIQTMAEVFKVLANIMKPFMEVFAVLTPLLDGFGILLSGLVGAFKGVVQAISSALGLDSLSDGFKSLRATVGQLIGAMLKGVAQLAMMFGMTSFVEGLLEGVGDRKNAAGTAVLQNPTMSSDIASFGRSAMTAAQLAGPDGSIQTAEEKWRDELRNSLKEMLRNGTDMQSDVVGIRSDLSSLSYSMSVIAGMISAPKAAAQSVGGVLKHIATAGFTFNPTVDLSQG